MPVRSRFRVLSEQFRGTKGRSTWNVERAEDGYMINRSWERCDDISPSSGGGPFTVTRDYWDGGVISMPWHGSYHDGYFDQYVNDWLAIGSWIQNHMGTDSPDDVDVATKVTKATNPSRPTVDVVTSLLQLPDSVKTVKQRFEQFYGLGKVAQTYLKYKFDVLPNVTDLLKMLYFTDAVQNRFTELERLKNRGLRRTVHIGSYSNMSSYDETVQSLDRFVNVPMTKTTTEKVWGYITWSPEGNFPSTDSDMQRLAVRAAYGITLDASTAWELVPWSWLVDWTSNIGDFVASQRNIVPAIASPVQVMRHRLTRHSWGAWKHSDLPMSMSAGYTVSERKTRHLVSPSLTAHVPILTGEHTSILASIGVLNGGNAGRRGR